MTPYKGKDYVKNGYLAALELESWNKISKEARWSVKKAKSHGLSILESKTTDSIKDRLFPKKMKTNQRCYYALDKKGNIIAGIVIEFFNSNILYKYSVSKEKEIKIFKTSFLIENLSFKKKSTKKKTKKKTGPILQ